MTFTANTGFRKQQGAILVISLVFLVAITLLTIASVRSSNIGLRMAQNEESRITAEQGAQAIADAIVSDARTTPVVGEPGYTVCTPAEANCTSNSLTITNPVLAAAIAEGYVSARVQRMAPALKPPPRITQSSIDKFMGASFEVTATYDRADESLGRQTVTEGVLVLVPVM